MADSSIKSDASKVVSTASSFDLVSGATLLGVASVKSRSELESESSPLPVTFLTPAIDVASVASPLEAASDHIPIIVPPSRQHPRSIIVLPRMIYIVDHRGWYLGVDTGGGLAFRGASPDASSIFEAIQYSHGGVRFRAANRLMVQVFQPQNDPSGRMFVPISCAGTSEFDGWIFRITHSSGNRIFLNFSDMPGVFGTMFVTNQSITLNARLFIQARQMIATAAEIFEIKQPIIRREIILASYDLGTAGITAEPPMVAYSTIVNNPSITTVITQTLNYSYTRSVVGTWNNALGWEIGTSATFTAGVPFIGSTEWEISVSASGLHEWGGSEGEERTFESSTAIEVQPNTAVRVTIMVRRAVLDINFWYDERITYTNGTTETTRKRGVYNNVESYHVDVLSADL